MANFDVAALKAELDRASTQVKAHIAQLIEQTSQRIMADHRAQMPRGTKPHPANMDQRHLADRVWVLRIQDMRQVVYSDAPHLHLVELGTRARYDRTKKTPAYRGVMPKMGPTFVPLGISRRAEMLRMAEHVIGLDRVI